MVLYIWLKVVINRLLKNISSYKKELLAVSIANYKEMTLKYLKTFGFDYKKDLLFGKQWDWQYSADKVIEKLGGDCNSIHRLFQVYYYLKGFNSYLVTIVSDDPEKCHATCIIEKDQQYFLCDYDSPVECTNYSDCINTVQKKYNIHKITDLVSQDINWKVVKI